MVTLKHWHKLPLVENPIMPTNSVCCTILFKTKIDKIDQIYIFRQAHIERIQPVTTSSLRIIIVVLMIPM